MTTMTKWPFFQKLFHVKIKWQKFLQNDPICHGYHGCTPRVVHPWGSWTVHCPPFTRKRIPRAPMIALPSITVHLPPQCAVPPLTAAEVAAYQRRSRYDRKAGALFSRAKRLHDNRPNGWVSGRQLRALLAAADYTCAYCGARLPESELTFDHMTPLARGGVHSAANLVVACKHCNSMKGARTTAEFAAYLAATHPGDPRYAAFLAAQAAATAEDDAALPATLRAHR
jgi:5-methylcytosine-specific restriction endonuclease McrA